MDWIIVAIVILFFTVAILTSDYWLDKFFGTHPIHEWDETRKFRRQTQALTPEPKQVQPDYLYWADTEPAHKRQSYIDFRPEGKR
jgi:hypothetical protein